MCLVSFIFGGASACAVPSAYSFGTNLVWSKLKSSVSASKKPFLLSPWAAWRPCCCTPRSSQAFPTV